MEITLLIKSIIGLIVFLAILLYILLIPSKKIEPKPIKQESHHEDDGSMKTDKASLLGILKNKKTSSQDLAKALDLILKHHGRIHKKLGERSHPEFDYYMDVLFTICRHPNTNKEIILNFDKRLATLNLDYKKDINEAIAKGLNSRGA
ncbi:MAG: hypothetical protein J7J31_10495 [Helicobacteraceae bacterium]|nr:hypothetical protein [Helicobacteraceae bacterium]